MIQFHETVMGRQFFQGTVPRLTKAIERIADALEGDRFAGGLSSELRHPEVKVKRLTATAMMPSKGSASAAGYDLYANLDHPVSILPHKTELIGTGLSMAIPEGYFGGIYARSGLASKMGLRPANCVGVIDSDYRGEVKVALHNDSEEIRYVDPGERIGQIVIQAYGQAEFREAQELDGTERGSGGFGSTGA